MTEIHVQTIKPGDSTERSISSVVVGEVGKIVSETCRSDDPYRRGEHRSPEKPTPLRRFPVMGDPVGYRHRSADDQKHRGPAKKRQ